VWCVCVLTSGCLWVCQTVAVCVCEQVTTGDFRRLSGMAEATSQPTHIDLNTGNDGAGEVRVMKDRMNMEEQWRVKEGSQNISWMWEEAGYASFRGRLT